MEINVDVFYLSLGYKDKVWEFLKEILFEFKLLDEFSFESKIIVVDIKLKELAKEVKDGKEFKFESLVIILKIFEKSDKILKGKIFYIIMLFNTDIVYKYFIIIFEFNDFLFLLLFIRCCENGLDFFFLRF